MRIPRFALAALCLGAASAGSLVACSGGDSNEATNAQTDGGANDAMAAAGDGGPLLLPGTEGVTISSGNSSGVSTTFCNEAVQSYTLDLTHGQLSYALCPASGPFVGYPLSGTYAPSAADVASLVAKLQAVTLWPASTTTCAALPTTNFSASLTIPTDASMNYYFDSADGCNEGDEEFAVQAGGIEAAYDEAASIVAAHLLVLEKGNVPVVTPDITSIELSSIDEDGDAGAGAGDCAPGDEDFTYTLGAATFGASVCGPSGEPVSTNVEMSKSNIAAVMAAIDALAVPALGIFCPTHDPVPNAVLTSNDGTPTAYGECNGVPTGDDLVGVTAALKVFAALVPKATADAGAAGGN